MSTESTFIMVKPDGVARGLVGEVIARFEKRASPSRGSRKLDIDEEMARRHYEEHVEKPFFPELLDFITSGPVVAMEWSGESAITVCRALMGATDPKQADPGPSAGSRPHPHPQHRPWLGRSERSPRAGDLLRLT